MKKHFVFITFIFSLTSAVGAYLNSDLLAFLGWFTAAVASIDHFFTLRNL